MQQNISAARKAALRYAELGYPVFPVTKAKVPFAGTNGHLDATADPKQVAALWDKYEAANVAIRPPGAEFDDVPVIVIDVDPRDGGNELFAKAVGELGELPCVPVQSTRRGGTHYVLRYSGNDVPATLYGCPGIDIKTHKGFFMIAPSAGYEFVTGLVAPEELPALPRRWEDHLARRIKRRRIAHPKSRKRAIRPSSDRTAPWAKKALSDEIAALESASDGERERSFNTAAFSLGQLIGSGDLDRGEVERRIEAACTTNGYIAEHRDFRRKLKHSIEDGMANPRDNGHVGTMRIEPNVQIEEGDSRGSGDTEHDESSTDMEEFEDGYSLTWRTAADIHDGVPEWVWEYGERGRLMRSTFALFAGRPAAGKSTAARYFAAGLSRGTIAGCFRDRPQNVAYIASEESLEFIVKPSLRAHGADLSRVHFPTVRLDGDEVRLQSIRDEEMLTKSLIERGITVVFVDPVMSAISGTADVHRSNETRMHVDPWQRIAEKINGLVIGIVHLKKSYGSDILAAINGSSAFGEIARAVIAFGVSEDGETRVLSQEKNSAGHTDLALSYNISTTNVETDDGITEFARFDLGNVSPTRVGDLLKADDKQLSLGALSIEVLDAVREFDKPVGPSDIKHLLPEMEDNDTIGKYMRRLAKAGQLIKTGRGLYVMPGRLSLEERG